MITQKLSDLKKLTYTLVYQARPGQLENVKIYDKSSPSLLSTIDMKQIGKKDISNYVGQPEFFGEKMAKNYLVAIKECKEEVEHETRVVYGRGLLFPENITRKVYMELHELKKLNSLRNIVRAIRSYIGEQISFFRTFEGRRVPVELTRVKEAYVKVKERRPIFEIEKALYD